MIGIYNYTVILTYLGMLSGFTGILCITAGDVKTALLCLMAAGFCDMFDGKIASTMERNRQEKRFGIQIDSLSDLICFGVLPAMIGYHCAGKTALSAVIAAGYVLCALIRLAWFNVDEEQRQEAESSRREAYLGLPVTASALLLPLLIGTGWRNDLPFAEMTHWLLLGTAIAFLTPFRLKKPAKTGLCLMALMGLAAFITVLTGVSA
jgi:CDP-diacylglycerol--serine O-phosphatidyltransferase